MIELEKIAQEAAYQHSRCAKCNGICPDTATNCNKSRMYVCPTYWNGYYTAIDALTSLCEKIEFPITYVVNESRLGLKETTHLVQTLREYATSEECGRVEVNKLKNHNGMRNKLVCVWENLKQITNERLPRYFAYSDRYEHLFVNLNDLFAFFVECANKAFIRNGFGEIRVSRLDESQEYTFLEMDYFWTEMECIIKKNLPSYFDYAEKVNKHKGVGISVNNINGFLQFFEDVVNITLSKDIKQKITFSKLKEE